MNIVEILNGKMKPVRSLGVLEDIVIKIVNIYGFLPKEIKKSHIVVASDNGIVEEGVSSCPQIYTTLVVEAMLNRLAAVGIFTKRVGAELHIFDVGMKKSVPRDYENLYNFNIMRGTNNFTKEKAIPSDICEKAINIGINFIEKYKDENYIFSNGEMGIGNTTTSSAILYSLTREDIHKVVGVGSGLDDKSLKHKKDIIMSACKKFDTFNLSPIEILECVGGLDIAVMVGLYLGCKKYHKLMLVDGFISSVALFLASKIDSDVLNYAMLTHKSEEPGMEVVINALGMKPFLNMNMRLGEGTGVVLVYPIIECALDMANIMKTPNEIIELFGR